MLLVAVIGVLTVALGVAVILPSLLRLRHSDGVAGEIWTSTDFTSMRIDRISVGALLAVAGCGIATAVVRVQLTPERSRR